MRDIRNWKVTGLALILRPDVVIGRTYDSTNKSKITGDIRINGRWNKVLNHFENLSTLVCKNTNPRVGLFHIYIQPEELYDCIERKGKPIKLGWIRRFDGKVGKKTVREFEETHWKPRLYQRIVKQTHNSTIKFYKPSFW